MQLSGGLNQQTGVFSGMFQDVEEGLAQISAARKDAGLAAGGQNGAEPDVDMEGGQDAEVHVMMFSGALCVCLWCPYVCACRVWDLGFLVFRMVCK